MRSRDVDHFGRVVDIITYTTLLSMNTISLLLNGEKRSSILNYLAKIAYELQLSQRVHNKIHRSDRNR
jgi:hypothetical protein